jgi:hypothetical protein
MELGLIIIFAFAWVLAVVTYLYVRYTDKKSEHKSSTK